jgi:hypothetical protein
MYVYRTLGHDQAHLKSGLNHSGQTYKYTSEIQEFVIWKERQTGKSGGPEHAGHPVPRGQRFTSWTETLVQFA